MTDPSPFEWQETLTGEMLLLELLGRVFYSYPENEERTWLQSLIDEDVFSEVPFAADKDETKASLEFLQNWGKNGIADEAFENMQADYTRLFIGPVKVLAPPWGSVHLGDDRLIFQQRTLEVRAWYKRFGLEAEKIHREPDDHIGLELLFLSHLAALGIQSLNEQDNARFEELLDAQREFFKKHLGLWALTWCGLVEENAQTDFYKGLAHLTRGALSALVEMLDVKSPKEAVR
ncbi:MAG: molecular chaperone TorD family protein [Chloroflexi bacterium]|nr:molecular chaperone TorD family protein [Chloroflexota bacterium]